jgi:hypothetical protein
VKTVPSDVSEKKNIVFVFSEYPEDGMTTWGQRSGNENYFIVLCRIWRNIIREMSH